MVFIVDLAIAIADKQRGDEVVADESVSDPPDLFVIQIPNRDRQCFGQVDGILVRF
jgi:hypothetical protein